MKDDATRERKPPVLFGQKGKPIAVGDKVKARYDKTIDYWPAVVLTIEGEGMTVQWVGDAGPGANVPLGSVHTLGADGVYGDGCSASGGASSSRAVCQKRKRTASQPTVFE